MSYVSGISTTTLDHLTQGVEDVSLESGNMEVYTNATKQLGAQNFSPKSTEIGQTAGSRNDSGRGKPQYPDARRMGGSSQTKVPKDEFYSNSYSSDENEEADKVEGSDGFDSAGKKSTWFKKKFWEIVDCLTVDEINEQMDHAKTNGSKRVKLHSELAQLLDEELGHKGASIIQEKVEYYEAQMDKLMKAHEEKMEALNQRRRVEEAELEKEYYAELVRLTEMYSLEV